MFIKSAHKQRLLKKWGMILESGAPIENEETKFILAQVLENTRNYYLNNGMLNEGRISQQSIVGAKGNGVLTGDDHWPYSGSDKGDFYLPNVVMPMLRRIMPDLIANELVAVQPLNGPVGFALAYRPQLNKNGQFTPGTTSDNEIGYNVTDTRWSGISAELDPAITAKSEYWNAYGNVLWQGEGASLDKAEFANINSNYPTVTFGLTKSTVEAKTRKLAAHWSPELAEDMQAMHGIDVEKEMVNTLTHEVGAEIDRQIITEMVKAAILGDSVAKWNPTSADGLDQMGRLATLLTEITIQANNIALKTRRGNANFVVTTPRVCALLQQLGMNKFTSFKANASMPSVPDVGVGVLSKVGLINDDQQLLIRDAYVQGSDSDYVLMGYKGKQVGDSGLIYCPYIPLQLQRLTQPDTFSYSIGARTRYGIMNNPWEAKNYYCFMKIESMNGTYKWDSSDRKFIQNVITLPADRISGNSGSTTPEEGQG